MSHITSTTAYPLGTTLVSILTDGWYHDSDVAHTIHAAAAMGFTVSAAYVLTAWIKLDKQLFDAQTQYPAQSPVLH